jgi:arginase
MKKLHFYKLKSRLGLINFPNGMTEYNVGVENGADSILTTQLLGKLTSSYTVDEYVFPNPEEINADNYFDEIATHSRNVIELINSTLASDEMQVVIGGDHSVGFPSLAAVLQRNNPAEVGMILFDSHGEMHLQTTSPTGNFHGMWMRPLVSKFDVAVIDQLVPKKLPNQNLVYAGVLDIEPAEIEYIACKHIKVLDKSALNDREQASATLVDFVSKFKHIHVSLDVDVFDKSVVTATGIPGNPGVFPGEINYLIELLAKQPSASFDIVELNATKPASAASTLVAQNTLLMMLGQNG